MHFEIIHTLTRATGKCTYLIVADGTGLRELPTRVQSLTPDTIILQSVIEAEDWMVAECIALTKTTKILKSSEVILLRFLTNSIKA